MSEFSSRSIVNSLILEHSDNPLSNEGSRIPWFKHSEILKTKNPQKPL